MTVAHQASLSSTLLEFAHTQVHWVGDVIQPSHPLSSPFPPALSLSQHQSLFQWVGSSHQMVKVLEFQLWHQSFQGIFRVDFLRIDWFDLLAIKGILKSFLQHHNSKASILWCSAFFMVQLSHLYVTTRKTVALIIWTFVGRVMSLLFNILCRFAIAFLPGSKHLLITWLQSPSAVTLEPKKMKSVTVLIVSPSISHEVMELNAWSSLSECWALSQLFNSLSLLSRGSLAPLHFLP